MPDSSDSQQPLYVTNAEEWMQQTAAGPDLLCVVLFRGSWCKYDKHYLRKLGYHHVNTMKKEKVTLIAWTSEGADGAKKADEEWGLTKDFGYDQVIGDETNALANYLKEDMVLPDLAIVPRDDPTLSNNIPEGSSYPNGVVLPGVIWYAHHGTIALQWVAPSDGGPQRPDPVDMYEHVLKRKHALDHGNAIMPIHGSEMKMCTTDLEVLLGSCAVL